jgi:type I restriction enzyme, S subunit
MSASKWKPYPEYKESGMKWQSSIPKKWKKVRLRFLGKTYGGLTGKKGKDFSKENNLNFKPYIPYTNILNQTYISKSHFDYVFIGEEEKQNLAKSGDLFFLMSSESYQDLGKSSILIDDIDELYLNSFCKGFRVSESMIDPLFLNYQLQGHLHKQLISTEGKGFTRINLSQERLLDTLILIPSLSEQKQVTNFLDTKIPMINHTIEQLEDTLSILEEKRLALITQAVTKGLNPDVEMKDSGIEWLGIIPEHWGICALKFLVSAPIIDGPHLTPIKQKKGVPFISAEAISGGYIDFKKKWGYISKSDHEIFSRRYSPQKGDILMVKLGATTGTVAMVDTDMDFSVWVPLATIRIRNNFPSKFIFYFLQSSNIRDAIQTSWTHGTQQTLGLGTIANLSMPTLSSEEANQIVTLIESKVFLYEKAVKKCNNLILLLQEYRTALITAAVTGKIDVCESV